MNNFVKILGLCFLITAGLFSCTKELTLEPTSQISNASFWRTESDAQGGLYGMYARFRTQAAENLFLWGESRSETVGVGLSGAVNYGQYYGNTLNKTVSGPTWEGLYTVVHDANLILKYVPDIVFTSENTKNNMLAQAHAMRAYLYFIMVRTWGGVPLVTEPTLSLDADAIQKERSSKEAIFSFIKQEIETALSLFSDNNFPAGRNLWSKPAVNALKGDVFLWTGKQLGGGAADFSTALAALDGAAQSDVTLLENFDNIFRYENKGNNEILMAIKFNELESPTPLTVYFSMYMAPTYMPTNIDDATKEAVGPSGGINYLAPSPLIRSQFTDDDQRKKVSYTEIYTITDGVPSYFATLVSKFKGTLVAGVRTFVDDVILYRYADVLLMKAEAKNALTQDPSEEINLVRQRAYGADFSAHEFVSGSQEQNDESILKERLFELAFEGKRWWDLIRFNKAFEIVPTLQARPGDDFLLLFPISETTLSLEPKVVQNPGYN